MRQPGEQDGHPRDVPVVLTGLVGGAQDHLVHGLGRDAGAAHGLADDERRQVVGAYGGEGTTVAALRGAGSVDQIDVFGHQADSSVVAATGRAWESGIPGHRPPCGPPLDSPWGGLISWPCRTLTEWSVGRQGGVNMTEAAQASPAPAERMFAADEASQRLGIELVDVGEGTAVLRMTVTKAMVNGHGIAHGGYVFLLADSAFACACNSHGPVTVASGADVTFVAPAYEGDVLTATAEEVTRFGRSGVYDVSVRRGDAVVAVFRGRSRTFRDAQPEEPQ